MSAAPISMRCSYAICSVKPACPDGRYTLLRRYGQGVLKERASSQSILAVGEMMKAAFCMYMVIRARHVRATKGADEDAAPREEAPASISAEARRLAITSAPMAVPALIFLAMNLLSFVALRRISASAFTLIQQSKIIATAVLSRLVLDKRVSGAKWRALGTLLFAVLVICQETRPQEAHACDASAAAAAGSASGGGAGEVARRAADYAIGLGAVTLEAILSGFSNVCCICMGYRHRLCMLRMHIGRGHGRGHERGPIGSASNPRFARNIDAHIARRDLSHRSPCMHYSPLA